MNSSRMPGQHQAPHGQQRQPNASEEMPAGKLPLSCEHVAICSIHMGAPGQSYNPLSIWLSVICHEKQRSLC